jgi:hypothetical protein
VAWLLWHLAISSVTKADRGDVSKHHNLTFVVCAVFVYEAVGP